jgi:hypothetical protein
MKKVIIFVLLLTMCGCATSRPKDYCLYNEEMVITVHRDDFRVECRKPSSEVDRKMEVK